MFSGRRRRAGLFDVRLSRVQYALQGEARSSEEAFYLAEMHRVVEFGVPRSQIPPKSSAPAQSLPPPFRSPVAPAPSSRSGSASGLRGPLASPPLLRLCPSLSASSASVSARLFLSLSGVSGAPSSAASPPLSLPPLAHGALEGKTAMVSGIVLCGLRARLACEDCIPMSVALCGTPCFSPTAVRAMRDGGHLGLEYIAADKQLAPCGSLLYFGVRHKVKTRVRQIAWFRDSGRTVVRGVR